VDMDLSRSIDFLLENASAVIQYRLRKEILDDLSASEEQQLLELIYQTPNFQLVAGYAKPNGYIGSGMHSWDNWRGQTLHETPLQDGEAAARLLAYYAVPKTHALVQHFVAAMRDEDTLRHEFSYIPPEVERFETRFLGLNSGYSLMVLIYVVQAMLGYGDDVEPGACDEPDDTPGDTSTNSGDKPGPAAFRDIALEAHRSFLQVEALTDITKTRASKSKYNYPYIEEDMFCPSVNHLAMLAYTKGWRTEENVVMMARALNHRNVVLSDDTDLKVRIKNNYYSVGLLFRKYKPFRINEADGPGRMPTVLYRRVLTEIAMLGVGERVGIIRESVANVAEALEADGILHLPRGILVPAKSMEYPTAYADVRLEPDYQRKYALECDLTFWAVQFLHLVQMGLRIERSGV